ncbi:MAG: ATPase [Thermanaeromonas sp.]|uniref:ATPase n=1 Tax=Thermanaeromonas sp. TaxID=2003697 RepID=UPI00243DDC6C|nr:ATPase [Thermanaeromonas sp.]MCG0278105.1 ATPase [Thermanaeromonas sp.]
MLNGGSFGVKVIELIDELEKLVERSPRIPFTERILIEGGVLLDYLDRLRTMLPDELRQAQWIQQEKERLLAEAQQQAKELLAEAEQKARQLVQETELVRQARIEAGEITNRAQRLAMEIRTRAVAYADEVLGELENYIMQVLSSIRQGRQELEAYRPSSSPVVSLEDQRPGANAQ